MIKDIISIDDGILKKINSIYGIEFLDESEIETIDMMFYSRNSNRGLSQVAKVLLDDNIPLNFDKLAKLVYTMSYDKWYNINEVFEDKISLKGVDVELSTVINNTIDKELLSKIEKNMSTDNKISAFDSDTQSDDTQSISNDTDKIDNVEQEISKRELTQRESGNRGNTVADRRKTINYYKENYLYNVILDDLNYYLTTLIF